MLAIVSGHGVGFQMTVCKLRKEEKSRFLMLTSFIKGEEVSSPSRPTTAKKCDNGLLF